MGVLGAEDSATLSTTGSVANLHGAMENGELALPLLAEVTEIQRRVLGPEHPTTLRNISPYREA